MSGRCPPPGITLEPRVRHRGDDALGERDRDGDVGFAVDDERRAGDALEKTSRPLPIELELLGDHDFRCRLQADRDHLGDHIGRIRLREDAVHERHDEPGPVGSQGLEPAGVGRCGLGLELHIGRDHGQALESLGIVGNEKHRGVQSSGRGDERGVLDSTCFENRECVGRMEWEVVAALRPVTRACSSRVVRDDGRARLERRNLVPDDAPIDDVPRRHEQDGPLAAAVPLPGDSRPIAARGDATRRRFGRGDHTRTIRASSGTDGMGAGGFEPP